MNEKEQLNGITRKIIGAAIDVHRALGPGKLESAYANCLDQALKQLGLRVEQQKPMPLVYHGLKLRTGYRLDLLVDEAVVVEIKAVERLTSVHSAQVRSYLKLSGCKVGLLINFNVKNLSRDGIVRRVNGFPE